MLESIFNGLLVNVIYDALKAPYNESTEQQLRKVTNYKDEDCLKIMLLINNNDLSTKEEIYKLLENNNSNVKAIMNNNYKTNFSVRLDYLLSILRKYWKEINVERLCYDLGYKSSNELLKYYREDQEPTYDFIDDFSNKIGVDSEWMKYGENNKIFETQRLEINKDLINYIRTNNINSIYFAFSKAGLSKYDNSQITMIFKFDDLKFVVNSATIPFGGYVGGHGESIICKFYLFLLWLKKENILNSCHCVSIPAYVNDEFQMGVEYGHMVTCYNQTRLEFILDDILDNAYDLSCNNDDLKKQYGNPFLECIEIIRRNEKRINREKDYWFSL